MKTRADPVARLPESPHRSASPRLRRQDRRFHAAVAAGLLPLLLAPAGAQYTSQAETGNIPTGAGIITPCRDSRFAATGTSTDTGTGQMQGAGTGAGGAYSSSSASPGATSPGASSPGASSAGASSPGASSPGTT